MWTPWRHIDGVEVELQIPYDLLTVSTKQEAGWAQEPNWTLWRSSKIRHQVVTWASEEPAEVKVGSRMVNSVPKETAERQGAANSALAPSATVEVTHRGHHDTQHKPHYSLYPDPAVQGNKWSFLPRRRHFKGVKLKWIFNFSTRHLSELKSGLGAHPAS
jgi:hypothetical protein